MRRTNPNANRPFRAPLVPLIPILGILTCLLLMFSLPAENWYRLIIWLLIGLAIYFLYGRRHSVMAEQRHTDHEVRTHGLTGQAVADPDAPAGSPIAPVNPRIKE
jgi:amino acid transporter